MRSNFHRLAVLGLFAAIVGHAQSAQAYPQWQFSTGTTRCNQCHYAPGGGGLINDYGRDADGDDLSTWQGDGSFLHGAATLPSFVKLGADLRLALAAQDNGGPEQPAFAVFPMQLDGHIRLAFEAFSFQAIGGVRGQVRRTDAPIPSENIQPENSSRIVSREHWVSWQPEARGYYARAGRFFAPFGLRLAEHLVYVRRDLGFNTLQETYNVSAGYLENQWEAHVTVFGPDFLQAGTREAGVAAYGEYRLLDETAAVGLQTKYALDAGFDRFIGGAVGKLHIEPVNVLLMGEANYVRLIPDGVTAVGQFVGLVGASWFPPVRGIILTGWVERLQGDIATADTGSSAATASLSWFPYPHTEIQAVDRVQGVDGAVTFNTFLLQLHYFM
ncbi:MAG: hypothetical protein SGI86_05485 [Deltaproteobacteria bacterium]|nr:hypothetical protein [Deltaproteobacteria bacterium]